MKDIDIQQLFSIIVIIVITTLILLIAARIRRAILRKINRIKFHLTGGKMAAALVNAVVEQTNTAARETPLSLSNLESLYLPKIKAAYPDLNPDDLRNQAGIVLKEYLDSVKRHTATAGLEQRAAKSLCDSVCHLSGVKYTNSPYSLYQALVSGFDHSKIRFDIAYKSDCQRKATVEFAYMKDVQTELESPEQKCTNCGAVLTHEAQTAGHCLYCDQVFRVVSDYAWLAVKIIIH